MTVTWRWWPAGLTIRAVSTSGPGGPSTSRRPVAAARDRASAAPKRRASSAPAPAARSPRSGMASSAVCWRSLPSIAAQGSPRPQRAPRSWRAPTPSARTTSRSAASVPTSPSGWAETPACERTSAKTLGPQFGQLYKASPFGGVRAGGRPRRVRGGGEPGSISRRGEPNSNPVSVLARPGRQYVVDAGGNDLLKVGPTGRIRLWRCSRSVSCPHRPGSRTFRPSSNAGGSDRGGPRSRPRPVRQPADRLPVPRRRREHLSRRASEAGEPEVYASGLTNVTDLAFGPDGSLYVVQIATEGFCSRILPVEDRSRGSRPMDSSEASRTGLDAPYGVTVSRKGRIYVSTHSTEPGAGEVVRVDTD